MIRCTPTEQGTSNWPASFLKRSAFMTKQPLHVALRITKGNIEMKRVSELTTDKTGPHVLLLAGVHGDEYEPMVALAELATELEGALLKGTVTIDPLVNEGAFARGNRIADDGLDLAR